MRNAPPVPPSLEDVDDCPPFSRLSDQGIYSDSISKELENSLTMAAVAATTPVKSTKQIPESLQKRITKTKLCIHYARGRCIRGELCSFAHSSSELREPPNLQKTRLCVAWIMTNSCFKGNDCKYVSLLTTHSLLLFHRYAHGQAELRWTPEFYRTSLCPSLKTPLGCLRRDQCRYAHSPLELRAMSELSRPPSDDWVPPPPTKVNMMHKSHSISNEIPCWRTGKTISPESQRSASPGLLLSDNSPDYPEADTPIVRYPTARNMYQNGRFQRGSGMEFDPEISSLNLLSRGRESSIGPVDLYTLSPLDILRDVLNTVGAATMGAPGLSPLHQSKKQVSLSVPQEESLVSLSVPQEESLMSKSTVESAFRESGTSGSGGIKDEHSELLHESFKGLAGSSLPLFPEPIERARQLQMQGKLSCESEWSNSSLDLNNLVSIWTEMTVASESDLAALNVRHKKRENTKAFDQEQFWRAESPLNFNTNPRNVSQSEPLEFILEDLMSDRERNSLSLL
ncbi:uncharacterized protein LOC129617129 [Condylostylus longicornis]|uniref:uncharacterized protein LOC129617129 n=1 Tax=Condylostylus longicornis TaxID=2530218 RepID=UPI00244E45C7|nr:uncharacterized protein LOC129617129 [Condylostylus longicornis]